VSPPTVQLWPIDLGYKDEMNNHTLAKLVVLTIVLILAIVRLDVDRHEGCRANCPTEISAQRREGAMGRYTGRPREKGHPRGAVAAPTED
jgi:hypothetical protein